jgi:transposase
MDFASIFSSFIPGFQITQTTIEQDNLIITARIIPRSVYCPECNCPSSRVHSYYTRNPHDLSFGFFRLRLNLTVRRMRCMNMQCKRKTFAERMPDFLPFHAQRTLRQTHLLQCLMFEMNGEAGSRICRLIKTCASPDTIIRIARRTTLPKYSIPRIIGIDDWAIRKGVKYGTLIVDLEQHRPIAVLPDRTMESIKSWLQEHPSIQMVCRDRYSEYIEGIRQGAPTAVQITDRWHLLRNLSDTVRRMFAGLGKELQEVANLLAIEEQGGNLHLNEKPMTPKTEKMSHQDKLLQDVKILARQGYSNRQIAKMLPIHRETVARYKIEDRAPVRGGEKKHIAVPYEKVILQLWQAGCHSPKQIYLELKGRGFKGSMSSSYRYLLHLGMQAGQQEQKLQPRRLTAGQAAWLLTAPEQKLNDYQKRYREKLCSLSPVVLEAFHLANGFILMVKEQKHDQLSAWIENAQKSSVSKLRSFSTGLVSDYLAVHAALSFDWSNGQLEGQVNRLKTIKRLMYGRANFDLLQKRILCQ